MSVLRTFVATSLTKGAGLVLTFVAGVLISRALGTGGKGQVDALVGIAAFLYLAFPSTEEPQLFLLGRRRRPPAVFFANGLVAALIFGAVVFAVFEALGAFAPGLFTFRDRATGLDRPMDTGLLRLLVLIAPLEVAHRVLQGLLQGLRDMRSFNAVHLTQSGLLVLGVVAFVVIGGGGVAGAVHAHMLSMGASGLLALVLAARRPEVRAGPFRCDAGLFLDLLKGGLRIHGGVIAAYVILSSDILLLNRFQGPEQVGLYALAGALTGQVRRVILQPAKEVLGSRLPEMVGDPGRVFDAVARTCRHTVLLSILPSLGLLLLGRPFIALVYKPEFAPAYLPLLVLLPGSLFWSAAVVLSYWFIGQNRLLLLTLVGVVVATTNVLLNLLFIPEHGMMAAAWTSTFCYGLHLTIFAVLVARERAISIASLLLPRREDFALWRDAWRRLRGRPTDRR